MLTQTPLGPPPPHPSPSSCCAVHFWAPTTKWLISAANIIDLHRPVEKMSAPQQIAVGTTGAIWSVYSLNITPVNYNLLIVNAVMATTSIWHLSRMANHYYFNPPPKQSDGQAAAAK